MGSGGYEWDDETGVVRFVGDRLEVGWQLNSHAELICVRLRDIASGAEWTGTRASGGLRLDGVETWCDDHVWSLAFDVRRPDEPLRLRWTFEVHQRHGVVRSWAAYTNVGAEPVVVERLPIVGLELGVDANRLVANCGLDRRPYRGANPAADWYTWRIVELRPGLVESVRTGYRQEATWLGLVDPRGGPGLYVGWETNAETRCEYGDLAGDGQLGVSCSMSPEYRLEPGETLSGPAGFVGLADGDLDEISYRCQRFVMDTIAPVVEDPRFPYVEFNSWGYDEHIDAEGMKRCLDVCERLGVELFVVDFGWEDPDWRPRSDRFPEGLAPIAAQAHDRGLLFGVHLSFGNVSSLSRMYAEHPEWAHGEGKWAYRSEGEVFGLTLGNPATREWIVDKLVSIVDENHIDYFLTDHYLWGWCDPNATALHATNDYTTVVEGYEWVMDRLRERRPGLVIEHCDDGLGLPTFQMVRQHMTSIGIDAPGSHMERVNTYRISRVLPPRYLDHYATDQPMGDWELRSHMFGGPLILMTPVHKLDENSDEWRVLTRNIQLYKEIRHRVERGKILHLIEPQVPERVGDGWDGWDAIGSYDEQTDTAVLFVFRMAEAEPSRVVPLHGLRPDTTYRVESVDRNKTVVRSGAELSRDGLRVELRGPGKVSEVIRLEPVDAGD